MSATETWEMDILEMIRQEIVHQKDTGDIISHADIDDAVRDIISNMDTDDFVDTDTVADAVTEHWSFNDNVAGIVNSCLEYEGYDALPGEMQEVQQRIEALEESATGSDTDNEGYNALVNTVSNLTERIVYMEAIINSFVDWADSLGDKGNHALAQHDAQPTQTTDDAPYAAI